MEKLVMKLEVTADDRERLGTMRTKEDAIAVFSRYWQTALERHRFDTFRITLTAVSEEKPGPYG